MVYLDGMARGLQEIFSELKDKQFFGVDEFVDGANEFVRKFNSGRDKKIEKLDVRTIRFYLSKDSGPLLQPEKKGTTFLFRYDDLIKLIAIRWFIAQDQKLSLIRAALREMTVAQLERVIGEPILVFADRAELDSFVKSSGEKLDDNYVELRDPVAQKEFLDEQKRKKESVTDDLWRRIDLDHGLELNIATSFKKSLTREEENSLMEKFRKAISETL